MRKELQLLEEWLDRTSENLRRLTEGSNNGKDEGDLNKIVEEMKTEYVGLGFMKQDIQTEMNRTQAERPFSRAKLGTLREKHNTVINIMKALYKQNPTFPVDKFQSRDESSPGEECNKDKTSELSDQELESLCTFTDHQTTFNVSKNRQNAVTDKLFIGSFYVGESGQDGAVENELAGSKAWRVRL